MAVDSFADTMAQLAKAIELLDDEQTNIDSFVGKRDTIEQAIAGDFATTQTAALLAMQNSKAGLVTSARAQALLTPFVNDVILAIDGDLTAGFAQKMVDIRDYMAANSQSINSRTMSYGSFSYGGSNVGNAVAYQLAVDRLNSALQGGTAESIIIECSKDQASGARRNAETWLYKGDAPRDGVLAGSGIRQEVRACYDQQGNILQNSRFTSFATSAVSAGSPVTPGSTTAVANWFLSDVTKFKLNADFVTRKTAGQADAKSLSFIDNGNAYQLLSERALTLIPELPYLPIALVYRESSCDGTFTIACGSKSQAFTVSSLNNNAWNWLVLDRDYDLYYDRWKQDDARWTMTLASRTTGTLHVQEALLCIPTLVDGRWIWIVGGTTPSARLDTITQSNSQSANGVNQRWLSQRTKLSDELKFAFSLPSSGSPTIADA